MCHCSKNCFLVETEKKEKQTSRERMMLSKGNIYYQLISKTHNKNTYTRSLLYIESIVHVLEIEFYIFSTDGIFAYFLKRPEGS